MILKKNSSKLSLVIKRSHSICYTREKCLLFVSHRCEQSSLNAFHAYKKEIWYFKFYKNKSCYLHVIKTEQLDIIYCMLLLQQIISFENNILYIYIILNEHKNTEDVVWNSPSSFLQNSPRAIKFYLSYVVSLLLLTGVLVKDVNTDENSPNIHWLTA